MEKFMTGVILLANFLFFVAGRKILGELPTDRPLVIAHRGSSGELPQHTVEAYQLAVEQGADIIECDVAVTKDLKLICSHTPLLGEDTDVAEKFPDRLRSVYSPELNATISNYFTFDFTLNEIKTLRKVQPYKYRDQSYNKRFTVPTFEEYIAVAQAANRTVGIYPEAKAPTSYNYYLSFFNTTVEDLIIEALAKRGYNSKNSPCFLQSFELSSIQYMAKRTDIRLVYLMTTDVTDDRLETMSSYVTGIGPSKDAIVKVDKVTKKIIGVTDFMKRVKKYGYIVHPYTFRKENLHLAFDYASDPYNEYEKYFDLGVDGIFTDFPATMVKYMKMRKCEKRRSGLQAVAAFFAALGSTIPYTTI